MAAGRMLPTRVKIGYVSPQTGPLAPFGEADKWVIDQMKAAFKDGLTIGGKKHACRSSSRTASPTRTAPAKWPTT